MDIRNPEDELGEPGTGCESLSERALFTGRNLSKKVSPDPSTEGRRFVFGRKEQILTGWFSCSCQGFSYTEAPCGAPATVLACLKCTYPDRLRVGGGTGEKFADASLGGAGPAMGGDATSICGCIVGISRISWRLILEKLGFTQAHCFALVH